MANIRPIFGSKNRHLDGFLLFDFLFSELNPLLTIETDLALINRPKQKPAQMALVIGIFSVVKQ